MEDLPFETLVRPLSDGVTQTIRPRGSNQQVNRGWTSSDDRGRSRDNETWMPHGLCERSIVPCDSLLIPYAEAGTRHDVRRGVLYIFGLQLTGGISALYVF